MSSSIGPERDGNAPRADQPAPPVAPAAPVPRAAAEAAPHGRRSISAPEPSQAADSSRDVAHEDFLFHLYRGSELLQENRVLEAKEELEFALTMQPRDPKGQDLLAAVYFRVGLYPRAIQIYEGLCEQFARDVSVKVNLALCYLKTGQPEPARRMLQDAVRLNPEHKRAWGYLGLALQKLGDVEQAQIAFERGGHAMMARRLTERRSRSSMGAVSQPPELDDGIRSVAETAFSELDAGELRFALAEPASSIPREGPWHTLELGEAARPKSPYATTLPPAAASTEQGSPPRAASPAAPGGVAVRRAAAMPALLVAPAEAAVTLHPTGVLLVRVAEGQSFAGRLDALRAVAGKASTRVLHRRSHEADTPEVLGGVGSPLVRVEGAAQVVLGARAARELALLTLDGEAACVREDTLFGFELRLEHESRRVPLDADAPAARSAGEGAAFVQLRGSGALVVELAGKLAAIPHPAGGPLLVRREWLVGWLGHLLPRALPAAESPNGQRGLVAFSGEGSVLVSVG